MSASEPAAVMDLRCERCGAIASEGRFCSQCGDLLWQVARGNTVPAPALVRRQVSAGWRWTSLALAVALVILAVVQAAPLQPTSPAATTQTPDRSAETRAALDAANARISDLEGRLRAAQSDAAAARTESSTYRSQVESYQTLISATLGYYQNLTTVENGNVSWHFTDLKGTPRTWTYGLESFQAYAAFPRPTAQVYMRTDSGATIHAADPRPYVSPSFFKDTISSLTTGRTAEEFVHEAFNVKRTLVTYAYSLADENGASYKYPAETMTEGTGVCGDTTILLASMLVAGNDYANYGMHITIWIGYLDPSTGVMQRHASTVNHAFIEVEFADGSDWFLETTTKDFYEYTSGISGWSFPVTDTGY